MRSRSTKLKQSCKVSSIKKLLKKVNPDDLDEIDSLFLDEEPTFQSSTRAGRRLRLIALVSPKGGTGKTSIAMNLAGSLKSSRRQTAVMDLDPRATALQWASAGRGLPFQVHQFDPSRGAASFRRNLRSLGADLDVLIIDTPPGSGAPTRLALQVADLVLIPAGASALDLEATRETINAAHRARHGREGELPWTMIVPSRQVFRTRLARSFAQEVKSLDASTTPAIGQRVEVAAAATAGRLVHPTSTAGREFEQLGRHVWKRLKKVQA
jgi:chromosome partitioning protein